MIVCTMHGRGSSMSLCEPGLEMAAAAAADPMEEEEEVNCRAGEDVKLGRPDEGRVPPARPANAMRMGYN